MSSGNSICLVGRQTKTSFVIWETSTFELLYIHWLAVLLNLGIRQPNNKTQRKSFYLKDVTFRPRPHECVFKSLRFHFTENAMKVLRPHDRFARPHGNDEND